MNISAVLAGITGVHALAGIGWLGVSLHAAFAQTPPVARWTRKVQGLLAVLVMLLGLVLWRYLHAGGFGPREGVLLGGGVCSVAAAGLQHGMGRANERRLAALAPGDEAARAALVRKIRLAETLAAGLLGLALVLMLIWRQV